MTKEISDGPLVTVIIPSYNHAKYVAESVQSIISQTWGFVQLIVVDDGSVDDSVKILSKMSEEYGFEFVVQENRGLTVTLNEVLKRAKGKYFCMLSSDDVALPDKLERQVAFMERRLDVGLCGGSAIEVDGAGRALLKQRNLDYAELSFNDVFMQRLKGPTAPSMMARTEALRSVGGYDPNIRLEDMDMWLKLTEADWKIVCLEGVFAHYRVHDTNTYKNLEFMLDALLNTWKKYENHPGWPEMRNRFLISTFLKASTKDKLFAIKLLPEIPLAAYNSKVLRGLIRLGAVW